MSGELTLHADGDRGVEIHREGGGLLLRYVVNPETSLDEAPRPYAHPVNTLAGEKLTNFRPNDHRWHHALSFTIASVSGHNFWGGGSYRAADGYQWRGDHGSQRHTRWIEKTAARLAHALEWRVGTSGEILLSEERSLAFDVASARTWSLRWQSRVTNVTERQLTLDHYQSAHGLTGSHYTGLQFRGARELLNDHGDREIGIDAEGGLSGEAAVHGSPASWMEWRGQRDESLRRVTIRFVNNTGPIHWFVRRNNPLAAFPFHYERSLMLEPGAALALDHTLIFTDA